MLTSRYEHPQIMYTNPSFAEMVVHYLPVEEQTRGYTVNTDKTLPPSSKNSVLDEYHYLLLKETDCDSDEVKSAWRDWKELGKYEHGELYRRNLFENAKCLNPYLKLWKEISVGMDGPHEEMVRISMKWFAKGIREAKSNKD